MKVFLAGKEITGLCVQVILEKDQDAAGMEARIYAMCAPEEAGQLPRLNPTCGEEVSVWEEETQLFFGRVEHIYYDAKTLKLRLQCFDPAALLCRCECYGPLEGTPEEIAAALCRECGLEPGSMAEGDGKRRRLNALCGRSAYRAIRQVYGDGYVLEYAEGKVCIFQVGAERALPETGKLLSLIAQSSAEDAVTRVRICSGGEVLAEETDEAGMKAHGLRQKTETVSTYYESLKEQALAGLQGVSREANITLEGLHRVCCGQRVTLEKPLAGAWGDYAVTSVRICCKNGMKTTEMGLMGL